MGRNEKIQTFRSQNIGKVFQKNKLSKVVPSLFIHFYTPFLLLSSLPLKIFRIVKTQQKDKRRCCGRCIPAISAVPLTVFATSDLKVVAKVDTFNDNFSNFYIMLQNLKHKFSHLKFKCLFSDFVPKLKSASLLLVLLHCFYFQ